MVRVELDSSGNVAHYSYDGGGHRRRKIITKNGLKQKERLYLELVERYQAYDNNGVVTLERWTLQVEGLAQVDTLTVHHAIDLSSPRPVARYQYRDRLGSSTIEANEVGQVISYEEYYPYGASAYRAAASGVDLSLKRYRFTGKERDEETGLDYFGVRYYAPWLGRWTSGDPGGFVDGLNMYRYVRNNPVNGVDREGYSTEEVEKEKQNELSSNKNSFVNDVTLLTKNIVSNIFEETSDPPDKIPVNVAIVMSKRDKVLEIDYQNLLKTDYKVIVVKNASDAYEKLTNLEEKENFEIQNLFVSSHGAGYDFKGSYRFKIGSTKYSTVKGASNSKNLGEILKLIDGCLIIGACHVGSERTNGAEMSQAIAETSGVDVYVSKSWVYAQYGRVQTGSENTTSRSPNIDYSNDNIGKWTRYKSDGTKESINKVILTKEGEIDDVNKPKETNGFWKNFMNNLYWFGRPMLILR